MKITVSKRSWLAGSKQAYWVNTSFSGLWLAYVNYFFTSLLWISLYHYFVTFNYSILLLLPFREYESDFQHCHSCFRVLNKLMVALYIGICQRYYELFYFTWINKAHNYSSNSFVINHKIPFIFLISNFLSRIIKTIPLLTLFF